MKTNIEIKNKIKIITLVACMLLIATSFTTVTIAQNNDMGEEAADNSSIPPYINLDRSKINY